MRIVSKDLTFNSVPFVAQTLIINFENIYIDMERELGSTMPFSKCVPARQNSTQVVFSRAEELLNGKDTIWQLSKLDLNSHY